MKKISFFSMLLLPIGLISSSCSLFDDRIFYSTYKYSEFGSGHAYKKGQFSDLDRVFKENPYLDPQACLRVCDAISYENKNKNNSDLVVTLYSSGVYNDTDKYINQYLDDYEAIALELFDNQGNVLASSRKLWIDLCKAPKMIDGKKTREVNKNSFSFKKDFNLNKLLTKNYIGTIYFSICYEKPILLDSYETLYFSQIYKFDVNKKGRSVVLDGLEHYLDGKRMEDAGKGCDNPLIWYYDTYKYSYIGGSHRKKPAGTFERIIPFCECFTHFFDINSSNPESLYVEIGCGIIKYPNMKTISNDSFESVTIGLNTDLGVEIKETIPLDSLFDENKLIDGSKGSLQISDFKNIIQLNILDYVKVGYEVNFQFFVEYKNNNYKLDGSPFDYESFVMNFFWTLEAKENDGGISIKMHSFDKKFVWNKSE